MASHVKNKKLVKKTDLRYADTEKHVDRLFVFGFPSKAQGSDIWTFFKQFGKVTDVYLLRNARTNVSRGKCYVSFEHASDVDRILSKCDNGECIRYDRRHKLTIKRADAAERSENREGNVGDAYVPLCDLFSVEMEAVSHDAKAICINDKLPNSCLMHIFGYLSLAEQLEYMKVCKYWEALFKGVFKLRKQITLLQPRGLFTHSSTRLEQFILRGHGFKKALNLCPALRKLDLRAVKYVDMKELRFVNSVSKLCRNLTALLLPPGTYFSVSQSVKLVRALGKLERLEIPECSVTNKCVYALFATCKNLRVINLRGNPAITSKPFVNTPVNLQKFVIDGCEKVEADIFDFMVKKCRESLEHISASDCSMLEDECISKITKFCNLRFVNLEKMYGWLCPAVDRFTCISTLTSLRVLRLSDTRCVHDQDIVDITSCCTHLEELAISGAFSCVTPRSLIRLKYATTLKVLDVSYQAHVDDDCLEAFANLPQLQQLSVMNCPMISNAGLTFLALLSRSLVQLDISGNTQLEEDVAVLDIFLDNGEHRAAAAAPLVIYFGVSGLSKAFDELTPQEQSNYKSNEWLRLFPYVNNSTNTYDESLWGDSDDWDGEEWDDEYDLWSDISDDSMASWPSFDDDGDDNDWQFFF